MVVYIGRLAACTLTEPGYVSLRVLLSDTEVRATPYPVRTRPMITILSLSSCHRVLNKKKKSKSLLRIN